MRAEGAAAVASVIEEMEAGPNPVEFERPMSAEDVQTWIGRLGTSGLILLAEEDGEVLGFGTLDFDTQEPETASFVVGLRSGARRRGIGTRLAEGFLAHARDGGFKRVVGRLPDNNEAALSFLSSIGGLAPIINPDLRFELPL